MTPHEAFLKERQESEAWDEFLARTDSTGRTKGLRKCRSCKHYYPATEDFWMRATKPSKKHKWDSRCLNCHENGNGRRGSYGSRILRVPFEADYIRAIDAYQRIFELCHKMFCLLDALKPSMDGQSWRMDVIDKEWKEMIK